MLKLQMGISSQRKKTGEVKIKTRDNNGKPSIDTLYNILLALDLCDSLFSIIALMNLVQTSLFHKGFCMVLFIVNEKNASTLPHSTQRKHAFVVKNEGKVKITKANS